MTDLALWWLNSGVLPIIFGLVHCRSSIGGGLQSMNGLLNTGCLFGLRRITIFLSGRRLLYPCNFKCSGHQLLPTATHRALVPLMLRRVRRHPATAPGRGAYRWLLAHKRQLPLVVILWRIGVGGSCGRIQFWILIYTTGCCCWLLCDYLAWGSQRIVEVREIRLVETVDSVLGDLLLGLGFGWGTVDIWGGGGFVMGVLEVWKGSIISFWSIILRSKKNLHSFLICQPCRILWRLCRLCSSFLMR
jgi:hypothetical protein